MNKEKYCNETPAVIDLRKQPKEAYSGSKKLLDYESGEIVCLSVSGIGKPGGEAYADAIQVLYSFVYTLKFTLKGAGLLDFKILPLECKWGDFDPATTSAEDWSWTLQIRVPPEVTEKQIDDTARIIQERKGLELTPPERVIENGGRWLQLLHLGPYEKLGETYSLLMKEAEQRNLQPVSGRHREAYLSDPRRVAPEKLKTLVRLCVEEKRRDFELYPN